MKITVVEDDPYLREELIITFERKGYSVSGISSFDEPEQEILSENPDLLLLDLNLPGKSGFELCKWLKSRTSFPVLILTARDTLQDELAALGLGADGYLTKPCHPELLLAHASRLLQNYYKVKGVIQCGQLSLDTQTYKLNYKDKYRILPETEGKILRVLIENHPKCVSAYQIFLAVWGTDEFVDENILQVNMTRLRKSLTETGLANCILTERGHGYRLEVLNV